MLEGDPQLPLADIAPTKSVKAFLVFENLDQSTWLKTLRDSRSAYTSLRQHFLHDLEHPNDISAVDPLADDENVSLASDDEEAV